jgi:hypothetical protein
MAMVPAARDDQVQPCVGRGALDREASVQRGLARLKLVEPAARPFVLFAGPTFGVVLWP